MFKLALGFYLLYVAAVIAAVIGWVINLIDVIHLIVNHANIDAMFIGRIVGVPVFVVGAVLGWF